MFDEAEVDSLRASSQSRSRRLYSRPGTDCLLAGTRASSRQEQETEVADGRPTASRAREWDVWMHEDLQEALEARIADKDLIIEVLRSQVSRDPTTAVEGGEETPARGRPLNLAPLPVFNGRDKVDDGSYKSCLAKLNKHAELLH